MENVELCTSAAICVQRLACRAISSSAELLVDKCAAGGGGDVLVGCDDVATLKTCETPRHHQINLLLSDTHRRAAATDKLFPPERTRRDATLTDFR